MAAEKNPKAIAAPRRKPAPKQPLVQKLDRLIHEKTRLGIVSSLAAAPSMTFPELKAALRVSDGNLSSHARKLEDAGYLDCEKSFTGRKPRTTFRLTPSGRVALRRYLEHMEAIIEATRDR